MNIKDFEAKLININKEWDCHAKPTDIPITLREHTTHVYEELECIINKRQFTINKLSKFIGYDLKKIENSLYLSVIYHDWGKSHTIWQKHCKDNNLINVGLRHEFVFFDRILNKLGETNISEKSRHIFAAIFAHHSKLSYRRKDLISNGINILDKKYSKILVDVYGNSINFFEFIEQSFTSNGSKEQIYKDWYKQAFFRYNLQLADKRASILEKYPNFKLPQIDNFNFVDIFANKRELQKLVIDRSDDNILFLRSPTGAGKTLASILWGKEQICKGRCDRIVIAMPTQFTSNSLSRSVSNYVTNTNVYHGNAKLKEEYLNDSLKLQWSKTLENPVSVCTIDHLLNSMTLSREEQQHVLFNLVNSSVIIDEADFYDTFIQANIIKLLEFLYYFKVPVMVMSATLPDGFIKLIEDNSSELRGKLNKIVDDTSDNERSRIVIDSIIEGVENYNYKLKDIAVDKSTAIIYCNTVDRAKEVYEIISNSITDKSRVILYHSSFIENDKRKIEDDIIDKLGENSWNNNTQDGIVIMTQIGELSINISSDYILSDVAPFDRLVQRFGRGCRFNKNICHVDINIPIKDGLRYPAPYGSYDVKQKGWIFNDYLKRTIDILETNFKNGICEYNYTLYLKFINQIYSNLSIDNKSKKNANNLYSLFEKHMYINGDHKIDEDGVNEIDWSARNIDIQVKILIANVADNNFFDKMIDFELYSSSNTINIPIYKFDLYKKKGIIQEKGITISNNPPEMMNYIDVYNYDAIKGGIKL